MRTRRRIVLSVLLVTVAFGFGANPTQAAPTPEQLAPKLRTFTSNGSQLTQSGSAQAVVMGAAREGELAAGDVVGDAASEVVIGASDGKVYVRPTTGVTTSFTPFNGYTGRIFVAVGNLDGDAAAEIVAATGKGAPGTYRIFNGDGSAVAAAVTPYASDFAGGVRVAVGNVTGDATNEVITAPGPGGGPHVKMFDPAGSALGGGFFAYDPSFVGGAFVAAGNLDGDAADEILVGPGASADSRATRAFNGDGSAFTPPGAGLPALGTQPDVRVAVGTVNGTPSWAATSRHGTDAEVDTFAVSNGASLRADPADADGALALTIANGAVVTLDTGPRMIMLSSSTFKEHTRNNVTLYAAGLDLLAAPTVSLVSGQDTLEVDATRSGDDLAFSLPVPAFVESATLGMWLGGTDDPRQIRDADFLTIQAHDPPLDAFVTTGVGTGGGPHVRTFNSDGPTGGGFMAGGGSSGVRIARGDFDNDGVDEIVTAPGRGQQPYIRIYSSTGAPKSAFLAYDASFLGGLFVAVGDFDGDGVMDIVTAPDAGGGPHTKVFAPGGAVKSQFMAYDPTFTGGVRVAAADVDGDQIDEVVTAPGPGGGPHVKALTDTGAVIEQFMAYAPTFTGGVFVAGADLTGDAIDEVVTGPGAGGGPHIKMFLEGVPIHDGFMAFDPSFTGGVSVARVGDEMLGPNLVAVGAGPGGGPHVKLFDENGNEVDGFMAYDPNFHGGVFVAGGVA